MTTASQGVTVTLTPALLALFPKAPSQVEVTGTSVRAVIDQLDSRWPGMGDRLRDSTPSIRKHINVFVDGERATLETPLKPGAEIFVLTAISGG